MNHPTPSPFVKSVDFFILEHYHCSSAVITPFFEWFSFKCFWDNCSRWTILSLGGWWRIFSEEIFVLHNWYWGMILKWLGNKKRPPLISFIYLGDIMVLHFYIFRGHYGTPEAMEVKEKTGIKHYKKSIKWSSTLHSYETSELIQYA